MLTKRLQAKTNLMALVVAAGVLWCPAITHAQTRSAEDGLILSSSGGTDGRPGLELRLFRPAVDSKGHFSINASPILPHLDISFGLILDYAMGLMRMADTYDLDQALVRHNIWGTLHFNLGLFNWAVVGLQLPVGLAFGQEVGDSFNQWGPEVNSVALSEGWSGQALGDISLHGKVRFLRVERFPVGLAAVMQLQFMSGQARNGLGDPGSLGLSAIWLQAVVDGEPSRRFRWAVNAGYRVVLGEGPEMTVPNGGGTFKYDDQLTFGGAASFNLVRSRLDLVTELFGNTTIGSAFDWNAGGLPLEFVTGLKIFVERNSYLYLGGGTGVFSPGYSAPAMRLFAAWIFEPSIGDRDGDGIKDDVDQCPDDPEDLDDFEDTDGCPDPDNDRDGILDVDDECPMVPEDRDGDEDEDGCPEGDEGDRDGDGILDSVDQCPDDPEDIDQFEDEDGCPDPDNDQDGILDVDDLCPNEPEDIDGFEDEDGCPDPDNDQDRILDPDDQCPLEPEVYNGTDDEDGCPDQGRVEVVGSNIVIMDKIYFETDSAEIREISFPILDAVSATLRGNPQITLVEVQGHADERGTDPYNLRLTSDRSASVVNYLVQRGGVQRDRLRSVGYGERCPVDPAHNAAAWERNRRVEFKIIQTSAGPTGVQVACEAAQDLIPRD
jgi:outer membrane protein OmpA-like peptidoglycan-associated protein